MHILPNLSWTPCMGMDIQLVFTELVGDTYIVDFI